jgi:hypothetical protein
MSGPSRRTSSLRPYRAGTRKPAGLAAARKAPNTRSPRRARTTAGAVAPILIGLLAGACVETGDFGRPRPSLWNDLALPATGSLAARIRGEPLSPYVFTDDEQELRRRAWRFLMPAHERAWFERRLGEIVATRILPMSFGRNDRASYFGALMRDGGVSPASRYRRLSEDATADAKLIDPFAIIAARVVQADAVRLKALGWVQDLTTAEARNAAARVAENRCLIAWIRVEIGRRQVSYAYALQHLFIEAPQGEGIATEGAREARGASRRDRHAARRPVGGRDLRGAGGACRAGPRREHHAGGDRREGLTRAR